MTSLLWVRRDLRLGDHPALQAALAAGAGSLVIAFVVDPTVWHSSGPVRRAWLAANLAALDDALEGRLTLVAGSPHEAVPDLGRRVGATSVHVTRETTPFGRRRDDAVASVLDRAGVTFVETGTPYAVGPGRVVNRAGAPYRVFTPFRRAWEEHGWPAPAPDAHALEVSQVVAAGQSPDTLRDLEAARTAPDLPQFPAAGEVAALAQWRRFRGGELAAYGAKRNRADLDATSRLSPYLKLGAVHPRTLLHDVAGRGGAGHQGAGIERFVSELAWREFYADTLWHNPTSAWRDLRPGLEALAYDEPADAIAAWREGRTGYPIVDAGMRQLLATGWMHNRVRMITASFLTKDLHVHWPVGARHFLERLIDGDVASNSHGWQWVAGTGTDAAPYFRVFNPTTQGQRFDPLGDYVRQWIPQLRHLAGAAVHVPWEATDGYAHGYPPRIVDHAEERREALRRYAAATGGQEADREPTGLESAGRETGGLETGGREEGQEHG